MANAGHDKILSPFLEILLVLVRLDHFARSNVNADHRVI
jgi:hypothetical protein